MDKKQFEHFARKASVITDQLFATTDTISGFQSMIYEMDKDEFSGCQDNTYNVMSHLTDRLKLEINKLSDLFKDEELPASPEPPHSLSARMQ